MEKSTILMCLFFLLISSGNVVANNNQFGAQGRYSVFDLVREIKSDNEISADEVSDYYELLKSLKTSSDFPPILSESSLRRNTSSWSCGESHVPPILDHGCCSWSWPAPFKAQANQIHLLIQMPFWHGRL